VTSSPLRHLPNILTGIRFILVIPVLAALLNEHYLLALSLFIVAGITDGLDGLLARVYNWTSRFGAVADPLADKLLLVSSFIAFAWLGKIPMWLVILIVARDLWIVIGAFFYYLIFGRPDFAPSGLSKVNTCLQILLVALLLLHFSLDILPAIFLLIVMWLVVLTTALSFLHYTWMWGARALVEARRRAIVKPSTHTPDLRGPL
jgi:cardiolipin synthase (CMP-forming)